MGRTTFTIAWPATIHVDDGRTFIVEREGDADLRVRVEGTDEWRVMGSPEGEPVMIGWSRP